MEAQRILETQFMSSFHTGNFVLDTLIKGVIITVTTAAFFHLKSLVSNWRLYVDTLLSYVGMKKNKIVINWKVSRGEESKVNSSRRFESILHQVTKLEYGEAGVCTLLENPNPESLSFMVSQAAPFTLAPGVLGTIRTDQTEKQEQSRGTTVLIPETFVAEIYSRTRSLKELQDLLADWVEEFEQYDRETGVHQIQLFGRMEEFGRQFNFSERLFAILHQLEKKSVTNQTVKTLREFMVEESKGYSSDEDQVLRRTDNLVPEVMEMEKDVFCTVSSPGWQKDKEGKKTEGSGEITVKVFSKTLKMPQLIKLVKLWEDEYEQYNQLEKGIRYFVFNPDPSDKHSFRSKPMKYYTEFSFESSKTFDNIYFPEKEEVMKKIKFFRDNPSWYEERGIPHMLGLLLHGEPGCGKTSAIKAIANLTQRHIVSVPLKNVHNTADLYHALYGEKINKKKIPMDKRLYVLEDIDCGGLEDIVKRRKDTRAKHEPPSHEDILVQKEKKEREENEKDKKTLTLSDLLEAFDGVLEMKGRMMVITTNHLDRLDPALIRPGRIDTSLEFKRCSEKTILDIFTNFFSPGALPEELNSAEMKEYVWTPAEVVQVCINHREDIVKAIREISARKTVPKEKETEEFDFYS